MSGFTKAMSAVAVIALLSGCATVAERREAQRRDEAKVLVAKGDYKGAYQAISGDMAGFGSGAKQAAEIINGNPQFKSGLPGIISAEIRGATSPEQLSQIVTRLGYESFASTLAPDALAALRKEADDTAADGNRDGRLKWLLTDSSEQFPSLKQSDQRQIIYDRSVATLRKTPPPGSRPKSQPLVEAVFESAEMAGSGSREFKKLQAELPNLDLSTQDLKTTVTKLFPQYAAKETARREVVVKIAFDDRLIEEDAMPKLRQLSPNLTFVKDGPAAVNLSVKKLQWDERTAQPRTETVSYRYTEVNVLAAVLLMPENATYHYEYSTGGVELSYAFEVKATGKGVTPSDDLVRDRAAREWHSCSNSRVQNVYGGIQRADFVANDHMQRLCGSAGSPPSPDALRLEAIGKLVAAIGRIPAIAQASGT